MTPPASQSFGLGIRSWSWAGTPRLQTGLTLFARVVLGAVFALAAASKINAPGLFVADVTDYHILPSSLVGPFAAALPWIEVLVAVYLLAGLFLRFTAVLTAVLMVMFIIALVDALITGNTVHSCGCLPTSGPIGSFPPVKLLAGGATITPFDVGRDVVFLLLTACIFWGDRAAFSLDGVLFGSNSDADDE